MKSVEVLVVSQFLVICFLLYANVAQNDLFDALIKSIQSSSSSVSESKLSAQNKQHQGLRTQQEQRAQQEKWEQPEQREQPEQIDQIELPEQPTQTTQLKQQQLRPEQQVQQSLEAGQQPPKWDSSKCAVIGLAAGYGLHEYEIFVGSLRSTGYNGQIILGIAPNAPKNVLDYLERQKVKTYMVDFDKTYCTYRNHTQENGQPSLDQVCSKDYPDYKIQWGRFPLARDWIIECGDDCSDGIMLTDVRDAYFQSDPFQYASQKQMIAPIMLFEEIFPNITATHWLLGPVTRCHRDHKWHSHQQMICSGSTMGTREGILKYLYEMILEFDYWKDKQNCRFDMPGDDQSIHNYLFYSGKLDRYGVNKIPHRMGPIHVCGVEADIIFRKTIREVFAAGHGRDIYEAEGWVNGHAYYKIQKELNYTTTQNINDDGSNAADEWRNWLPSHATNENGRLIDPTTGYILNLDGMPSPQVHQYDRFAFAFTRFWLERMNREVWNPKG